MVSSQVHSQHPSHISFTSMRQRRSWVPNNADVRCRELETSKGWLSNITPDGHLTSSSGYACLGHVNMTSPLNSSWIQRLIPSQSTRVEQPQHTDKMDTDNCGIDGLQTNRNEREDHLGNQADIPFYEISRRSKQDFFNSRKLHRSTEPPGLCAKNDVSCRIFEGSDALLPEVHVLPKALPVVESLLPGCSEKAQESQIFLEEKMPHALSRCTRFAKPVKQTVHYSADENLRLSFSSIEAMSCCRVVRAAGDLFALKSLQQGNRGIGPLQPCSEFSLSSNDAVTPNIDTINDGKDKQRGLNSRTYKNSTQTEDLIAVLYSEGRRFDSHTHWDSSVPRGRAAENRLFGGSSKIKHSVPDGFEAPYASKGIFNGDSLSFPYKEKDELWKKSKLVPLHNGSPYKEKDELRQISFVAKEEAAIYSPNRMIEQDVGSSQKEQGRTSRSFSFHFENILAPEDHSKVVRKGQWPFDLWTLSSQTFCQSRSSEDKKARGLASATTSSIPCDKSFSFMGPGLCDAGTNCFGRNQSSPFFGTENLNSFGVLKKHDFWPHEVACFDVRGLHRGQMKIEALQASGVDSAMQTLKGRHPFSGLESNSMTKGMEGKETMQSFPLFKLSSQRSTRTCPPESVQSKYENGKDVNVNYWQAYRPLIRDSNYTYRHESTQMNIEDGNPCSIGSCSKVPSNFRSGDASTSVDARSGSSAPEKSVPFQEQPHGSQRQHASIGGHSASDDRDSAGKEATSWEASGWRTKKSLWMNRWSTLNSGKIQATSRPNTSDVVLAGMTRPRNYMEDHSLSQGIGEFCGRSDVRPAKRFCQEERCGRHQELGIAALAYRPENKPAPKSGSVVAVGKEHNCQAAASHFMKHFFTPSVAAMAIMGMTARKVKATQPQKRGLFSMWASNESLRKPSRARTEACKEFAMTMPMPNCKKESSQAAAMAPPAQVDS